MTQAVGGIPAARVVKEHNGGVNRRGPHHQRLLRWHLATTTRPCAAPGPLSGVHHWRRTALRPAKAGLPHRCRAEKIEAACYDGLAEDKNLEAISFLRQFNDLVHAQYPAVLTFAEEATAWPKVTGPTTEGGLGFDLKWNMGWMHDTLDYAQKDPLYRRYHHTLTFSLTYAFSERFVLPFSHDEVVYGKRAMLSKIPGDYAQKFANLRAFYGYLYDHPGKKLSFMGCELAQWDEWQLEKSLDWGLLDQDAHRQMQAYVRALNALYRAQPALHAADFGWDGFAWLDCEDADRSLLAFLRRAPDSDEAVAVVVNFMPVAREGYRLGVPRAGVYTELLNSDLADFGGSGQGQAGPLVAEPGEWQGQPYSVTLTLHPLAAVFLKKQ